MSSYGRYGGGSDRYGDRDRYGGDSRRHSSSSSRRGDSPHRHRSRRSPSPGPSRRSPKPRDPKSLPEAFGRVEEERVDDDLSVLQRMTTAYVNSPLNMLCKYMQNNDKVKIWTRNYKEVRGVMTGFIVAFDKHWNIVLSDIDEVFLKPKKCKTPFLRDVAPNENLPDMPAKVPKKKKEKTEEIKPEPQKEPKEEGEGSAKKKVRSKKAKATSQKRQIDRIFIRGDNIVLVSPADEDYEETEEAGEAEEGEKSETG